MTLAFRCASLTVAAVALLVTGWADAQVISGSFPELGQNATPAEPPSIEITEKLGEQVDPDLVFTDSRGREVRLGDLLEQGRPILLTFSYHTCPMLCSLVLDGAAEAVEGVGLELGDEFDVVNVSFDPRDGPQQAAEAKAKYVAMVGEAQPSAATYWHFLTGDEKAVRALAEQTGFGYAWDEKTGQYAHQAALIFLSPDGTVARYLYGIDYPPRDVRFALVEAGQGRVGSTLDRLVLTCFQYDATADSYTPIVLNVMKLGGVLLLLALAAVLIPLWLRERRRRSPEAIGPLARVAEG